MAGLTWHWDQYRHEELLKVSGGRERIRHFVGSQGIAGSGPLDDPVRRLHATKSPFCTAMVLRCAIDLRPGVAELISRPRRVASASPSRR